MRGGEGETELSRIVCDDGGWSTQCASSWPALPPFFMLVCAPSIQLLTSSFLGQDFGMPSKNITVADNKLGTGMGISIGSSVSGGVEDVL